MIGDMFSSNLNLGLLHLYQGNTNFKVNFLVQKSGSSCSSKGSQTGQTRIVESFQDNLFKEAKSAGAIICDPMNGNLIGFPKTMKSWKKSLHIRKHF